MICTQIVDHWGIFGDEPFDELTDEELELLRLGIDPDWHLDMVDE